MTICVSTRSENERVLKMIRSSVKSVDEVYKCDPLESLVGKICAGKTSDGRVFVTKLVEIRGDELWFETRNGVRIMNKRDNLVSLREVS